MLISLDLLNHIQKAIWDSGSPAQLCIMRRLGTDSEYILRVRHGDAHLDYPLTVPLLDTADAVAAKVNFDEIIKALTVMAQVVVKPGEFNVNQISQQNSYYARPSPCVLPPVV